MNKDGHINQITLGNQTQVYETPINNLVKTTPSTITRTVCWKINGNSFDFRCSEQNIISIKLLGFVDLSNNAPEAISFNEFWSEGTQVSVYSSGSQNYRPVFITGASALGSVPVTLVIWKNGNGIIQSTNITFLNAAGSPRNLNGLLYFEVEKGTWTK